MIPIALLGRGMHFGDSALRINKEHPDKLVKRNATIRCEDDCIFATMGKRDY